MKRLVWMVLSLVLAILVTTSAVYAHEVLHTVQRGSAVAVKVYFSDGEPLAYVPYEVYSPADPKIAYQKGRTDRSGFLAFVPNVPGTWRAKVFDESGHGLDAEVEIGPDATGGETSKSASHERVSTAIVVLRPLIGAIVVAIAFAILYVRNRRKERQK